MKYKLLMLSTLFAAGFSYADSNQIEKELTQSPDEAVSTQQTESAPIDYRQFKSVKVGGSTYKVLSPDGKDVTLHKGTQILDQHSGQVGTLTGKLVVSLNSEGYRQLVQDPNYEVVHYDPNAGVAVVRYQGHKDLKAGAQALKQLKGIERFRLDKRVNRNQPL